MFLESILFLQKLKISKIVLPCFGNSVAGHTSRMPQSQARKLVLATFSRVEGPVARGTQRFSRLSLQLSHEWDFQSRKTLSKFFQNFWLEVFWWVKLANFWRLTLVASRMPQSRARRSVLATCSRVEGPVARGTQRFSRLSLRLSHEWDFQSRKTLSNFFQNFWLEVFWRVKLATFWRLTSVAKISWFAKRSSFSTLFSKRVLIFFFLHPMNVHFLVSLSLFQHHRGQLQNPQLFCHHFLNLQGKVWVLSSTLYFS